MKSIRISILHLALLLSACGTTATKSDLVYGLGDNELNRLGERLGYRVDALGMREYSFTRGNQTFYVWAHNDISAHRTQADLPVVLTSNAPGRQPPLESTLVVAHGVPFNTVEEHFRRFILQISPSHP